MNILIIRHGEAHSHADSDFQRELTARGVKEVTSAGECLRSQSLRSEYEKSGYVWVSPYIRAQQTADHLLSAANLTTVPREESDAITPDCSPEDVVDKIQQSKMTNLILISHQPLVSALVGLLVSSQVFSGPPMSPGSMALLETDTVLAGCCTLKWLRHAPTYNRSE